MLTKVLQLSDESTGECSLGCGEAAYPFTFEGADGYVDTCRKHARKALDETFPELGKPMSSSKGRRHGDVGATISATEAASIRSAIERDERARKEFDPRRFQRGGGYTPAEVAAIKKLAGGAAPSNEQRSALEVHDFVTNPPEHLFAYYDDGMKHVKTWMGDILGTIVSRGQERRPFGGRVVSVHVLGINGVRYVGTCNLSSGTYCRLRRSNAKR